MRADERAALVAGVELRRALRDVLEAPAWEARRVDYEIQTAVERYDRQLEDAGYIADK